MIYMRIVRLGELLAHKYKIAGEAEILEGDIRRSIEQLWRLPNIKFNILRAAWQANPKKTKDTPEEDMVMEGFALVKKVVDAINAIKEGANDMDLSTMEKKLKSIKRAIQSQMKETRNGVNFPEVMMLVSALLDPLQKNKWDVKYEGGQWGKARTGLKLILEYVSDMLFNIQKLKMIRAGAPKEEIFEAEEEYRKYDRPKLKAQRVPLHESQIKDFILKYGPDYGLNSEEDWAIAFREDPEFKEEIHDIINALSRGRIARNDPYVKSEVGNIIREHKKRMATNVPVFETDEEVFKYHLKPRFISPQLKKEREQQHKLEEEAKQEEQEKLQKAVKERDEAWKRRQLEEQMELQKKLEEQKKIEEEENLTSKYSSSRLEQIMKRYQ